MNRSHHTLDGRRARPPEPTLRKSAAKSRERIARSPVTEAPARDPHGRRRAKLGGGQAAQASVGRLVTSVRRGHDPQRGTDVRSTRTRLLRVHHTTCSWTGLVPSHTLNRRSIP